MKRYKLLKDLPTFAKGDLFEIRGDGCLWWIGNSSFKCGWGQGHWRREVMAYHKNTLERFPNLLEEWFEKIEPKRPWYIDTWGSIRELEAMEMPIGWEEKPILEFGTREEAEKAVEKLKVWKRLKDNGFRFEGWYYDVRPISNGRLNIQIRATLDENDNASLSDLNCFLGGEDE